MKRRWLLVGFVSVALIDARAQQARDADAQTARSLEASRAETKKLARAVLAGELARDWEDACTSARTTIEINICYGRQFELTRDNYIDYKNALRVLLAATGDGDWGAETAAIKAAAEAMVKKFDEAEADWESYRTKTCSLVGEQYAGGTGRASFETGCHINSIRNHLRDLGASLGAALVM